MNDGRTGSDRRVVTVVSADLSRFTRLAERRDPEDTAALLDECFQALREEIVQCGGWIEKYIGDEVLAIFGAPTALEDSPARALHSALAVVDRVRALSASLAARLDEPLNLHVGVSTGLVIWGPGPEGELRAVGDTVNVCARLRDAARPGQVLVSQETYAAAQDDFEFRDVGLLPLKNKEYPVQAYECLQARALRHREFQSPLVGRQTEVALLQQLVEQLSNGSGGIVGVSGEAGQGKSRLVGDLRPEATNRGVCWLEGEALSYGRSISYWPFQQMVQGYLGMQEGDSDADSDSFARLEVAVRDLFGPAEYVEILPYLATLLALDLPPDLKERVRYLDGEAMGGQVFRSTRLFIERLARASPVVLVIDDVQWIDDSSARLLEHLLPLTSQAPILTFLVSRHEAGAGQSSTDGALDGSPGDALLHRVRSSYPSLYQLKIEPLDAIETAQLVYNLVGIDDPALDRLVVGKAEGNPFFIEEVLRSLIDAGALVPDRATGRWRLHTLHEIDVPASLSNLILARLDRLPPTLREVLDVASVVGRRFSVPVLQAALPHPDGVEQQLAGLAALELVEEAGELEYVFRHGLIQEAAYNRLLLRTRAGLHQRVGAAIETLFSDRLDEFHALLAHHYALAQDWAKAQDYLLRAGDQAGRLAADAEALAHYDEAMRVFRLAAGARRDPVEQAGLLRRIGEAHFRRGDHERAMDRFARGLEELECPYPTGRGGMVAAFGRELAAQAGHRLLPFLVPNPRPADDYATERARFYFTMTWVDYFAGRQAELMLGCLYQANFCERVGYGEGMVLGLGGLGIACDLVPLPRLAGWYHRRAAELAESLGHPPSLALAALGLSYHYDMLGEWDKALAYHERSRRLYREIGDLRREAAMSFAAAWLLRLKGEMSESRHLAEEMIRLGEEGADPHTAAWGYHALGRVQAITGDLEVGRSNLERAISLAEDAEDFQSRAPALSDLAECLLRLGQLDRAIEAAGRADRVARERSQRDFLHCQVRYGLGLVYLAAAEAEDGSGRKAALRSAKRAVKQALGHSRIARNGLAGACRLQGTADWLDGKERSAVSWWQRSARVAREMGARYDEALTLGEMGRRLGDEDLVRRSAELCAAMGLSDDRGAAPVTAGGARHGG